MESSGPGSAGCRVGMELKSHQRIRVAQDQPIQGSGAAHFTGSLIYRDLVLGPKWLKCELFLHQLDRILNNL